MLDFVGFGFGEALTYNHKQASRVNPKTLLHANIEENCKAYKTIKQSIQELSTLNPRP